MPNNIIYLKDRRMICENTLAMWFDYSESEFTFEPGQYTFITILEPIHKDEEGNTRIFSIASSPSNEETLMFTTRAFDSAFNKNILELPIGTMLSIGDTGGNTPLHKDSSIPAVFLIGGIGITPVRCMVEYITGNKLPYDMTLFYSNPRAESMAFLDEFEKWAEENKNFKLIPTIDDTENKNWKYNTGFISEELIKKHVDDFSKPIFYIVGPPALVDSMEKILLNNNVSPEKIKLEKFG